MHEGYEGDDIYIMVEDEFQSVAQSYTAHLHQAEYKRLMKEARNKPPKALPEPTSPMSKSSRNRLKSAILQNLQKDALRQVSGKDPQEEEDEDGVADLWLGTSLAHLMTTGSQGKTSLVGLERISSTTRAGVGLSRSTALTSRTPNQESKLDEQPSTASVTASSSSIHEPPDRCKPSSSTQPRGFVSSRDHVSTSRTTLQASRRSKFSAYLSDEDTPPSRLERESSDDVTFSRLSKVKQDSIRDRSINGKDGKQQEKDRQKRLAQVPMFMF